jgi:hypothetical protein
MVAMFEIAFLIVCVVLSVWWFRRTNLYRARRRAPRQSPGMEVRRVRLQAETAYMSR